MDEEDHVRWLMRCRTVVSWLLGILLVVGLWVAVYALWRLTIRLDGGIG